MLRHVIDTRDTTKLINLSSTVRNIKHNPNTETFELAFQLSTLRKTLDKYSVLNFQKEIRLRDLKLKLKELNESAITQPAVAEKQLFYKKTKIELKEILFKEEQELIHQTTLEWMFERMETTKDFLEKREVHMKKLMETQNHELDSATKLRKDAVDSVHQFKTVYSQALKNYSHERQALVDEISRLEEESVVKKKLIEKTEEHNRHRMEIVELTMIEDNSAHLEEMRNSHLLHKAIDFFFSKKIGYAKKEFKTLDDAFQKIRFRTGIRSVEELIERFLTQEENYSEITENIHKKEIMFVEYEQKIADIQCKVDFFRREKKLNGFENEKFIKASEEMMKLRQKKNGLAKIVIKINTWVEITAKKMFGTAEDEWKELKMAEKFRVFKEKLKVVMKEYVEHGVSKENEKKRKKMRLDEIFKGTVVAMKLRSTFQDKPIAMKSFHSRK